LLLKKPVLSLLGFSLNSLYSFPLFIIKVIFLSLLATCILCSLIAPARGSRLETTESILTLETDAASKLRLIRGTYTLLKISMAP
jgi:hypothetical protein